MYIYKISDLLMTEVHVHLENIYSGNQDSTKFLLKIDPEAENRKCIYLDTYGDLHLLCSLTGSGGARLLET
jgi:hypothetical protein